MEQLSPIDIWLEAAAEQFGTPAYVYDLGAIERRGQRIRQAFSGRFSISFAVKSNPNPALIHWLGSQVDYVCDQTVAIVPTVQSKQANGLVVAVQNRLPVIPEGFFNYNK